MKDEVLNLSEHRRDKMIKLNSLKARRDSLLSTQECHPWDAIRRRTFECLEDEIHEAQNEQV